MHADTHSNKSYHSRNTNMHESFHLVQQLYICIYMSHISMRTDTRTNESYHLFQGLNSDVYIHVYTHVYIHVYIHVRHVCTTRETRSTPSEDYQIATHCNTLQHTATHCNTLQHTQCNTCMYHTWDPLHTFVHARSRQPYLYIQTLVHTWWDMYVPHVRHASYVCTCMFQVWTCTNTNTNESYRSLDTHTWGIELHRTCSVES